MDDATVRAYLPGTREVALFAGLTLLGLVAWAFSTPSVAGYLFGERFYRAAYSFPLYFGLPLYALLAFLAGFFSPRGFWLWGAALYCLTPIADAALAWWVGRGARQRRVGRGPTGRCFVRSYGRCDGSRFGRGGHARLRARSGLTCPAARRRSQGTGCGREQLADARWRAFAPVAPAWCRGARSGTRGRETRRNPRRSREALPREPVGGAGTPGGRDAFYAFHVAEAECLQVRGIEAADGPRGVRQRVRALVAEVGGVGGVAGAEAVEDHYLCPASHV